MRPRFSGYALDFIFPPRCIHCRAYLGREKILCAGCAPTLTSNASLWCGKCRARIPINSFASPCHKTFPYVLGAPLDYRNAVTRSLIYASKFEYVQASATLLGAYLAFYAQSLSLPQKNTVVVPVPLGKKRLRERGFNQAEILARAFCEQAGYALVPHALSRVVNTKPQSDQKTFKERWVNIQGCFVVTKPREVARKTVLLIDDVATSGATLHEAALVLRGAGAKRVIALAGARA